MNDEAHVSTDPTVKYGNVKVISEEARKMRPIDELQRAEERVLSELVMKVHHDRMVGTGWPTISRHPMRWTGVELVELTEEDMAGDFVYGPRAEPTEWHIRAWVRAVPK